MTNLCERQPRAFNASSNRQGDDGGGWTMILLERAGRKRRGETPMDPICYRASDESSAHGGRGQIGAQESKF